MDPVAHTLIGACMGEAGLRKTTRLATPVLLVGANLPDLDIFATAWGSDAMYGVRRGWTHGILAMAVLPCLLAGGAWLWGRYGPSLSFSEQPDASRPTASLPSSESPSPPASTQPSLSWRWLLVAACVSVWSHPLLDWLNNYGVRLLMPFDQTWYYGDAVFIIDLWLWFAAAAGLVLVCSRTWFGMSFWSILGLLMTVVILNAPIAPLPKQLWCLAVVLLVVARSRMAAALRARLAPRLAQFGLLSIVLYAALLQASSAQAREHAAAWLQQQGYVFEQLVTSPMPAAPHRWDVVAVGERDYRFLDVNLLAEKRVRPSHRPLFHDETDVIAAALAAPQLAGYAHWLRLPAYRVEPHPEGHKVVIEDVRYSRMGATIGYAEVVLNWALQPVQVHVRK